MNTSAAGKPGPAEDAIDAAHRADILARLQLLQAEHGVRIVLAVESGSRAWGFASPDSDYDVRFVYVRPQAHYLSIRVEDRRDVIEQPIVDEIDLNGWDLRKALRLLARTNPAIVEWLRSPITYTQPGSFRARALALLPSLYAGERGIHHDRHMASGNYRAYLRGDRVRLKKYLYVLRPLFAVRWIEAFGTPPPMAFAELLQALSLPSALREAVDELLLRKRAASEMADGPPIPVLNRFIEDELARPVAVGQPPGLAAKAAWDALDRLFLEVLDDEWGRTASFPP